MIYRRFGKTELQMPVITCGGMRFQHAWQDTPGGVNIPIILWLRNLAVAYDMVEYGKMRYNLLGSGGHFFPGNRADKLDEADITPALRGHPLAERIPGLLRQAHALLGDDPVKRLSESES